MPSRMSLGAVSSISGMSFCIIVLHCSNIMVRSSSAVYRGMSARPAETHLWAVEGATFISSAICR